jgi:hypothetical protein
MMSHGNAMSHGAMKASPKPSAMHGGSMSHGDSMMHASPKPSPSSNP